MNQTQRWLKGEDDRLENFFSSSSSQRPKARRKDNSRQVGNGLVRKAGPSRSRISETKPTSLMANTQGLRSTSLVRRLKNPAGLDAKDGELKKRSRAALSDVTTHQNSPRLRRITPSIQSPSNQSLPPSSPTISRKRLRRLLRTPDSPCKPSKLSPRKRRRLDVHDNDEDGDEARLDSTSARQSISKPQSLLGARQTHILPSSPSNSGRPSQSLYDRRPEMEDVSEAPLATPSLSVPLSTRNLAFPIHKHTRTPLPALFEGSRLVYPTPESVDVPKPRQRGRDGLLKRLPAPALDTEAFKRPETPRRVHRSAKSTAEYVADSEEESDDASCGLKQTIPSSQTQYIHFSPSKRKFVSSQSKIRARIFAHPSSPTATVSSPTSRLSDARDLSYTIPSSQQLTQPMLVPESPRKIRFKKPTPIKTTPFRPAREGEVASFVVPTSQEDEKEMQLPSSAHTINDEKKFEKEKSTLIHTEASSSHNPARTHLTSPLSPLTPLQASSALSSEPHGQASSPPVVDTTTRGVQPPALSPSRGAQLSQSISEDSFYNSPSPAHHGLSPEVVVEDSQNQDHSRTREDSHVSASSSSQTEPDDSSPAFEIFGPSTTPRRGNRDWEVKEMGVTDKFRIPATPSQTQPDSDDFNPDHATIDYLSLNKRTPRRSIFAQSSMTEPDESQWTHNPFAEAEKTFKRSLVNRPSEEVALMTTPSKLKMRKFETQESMTQSDDEEVDGLVGLYAPSIPHSRNHNFDSQAPPPPTASTFDQDVVDDMLAACSPHSPSQNSFEDQDETDYKNGNDRCMSMTSGDPMPDIGSEDSEHIIFTPRRVRRAAKAVAGVLNSGKCERADDREGGDEMDDWEGLKAVKDFLGMFSPSQSQASRSGSSALDI